MTKPSISKKSRYTQGVYTPVHPEKYIGESEVVYRSSWEKRLMGFLDNNNSVLFWNSESAIVKYVSPLDNKIHKYYVDFLAKMKLKDGSIKTYAIELKPIMQTKMPLPNKNKERFLQEMSTYLVNQAKWKTATEYFAKMNVEFMVLTEKDLGI